MSECKGNQKRSAKGVSKKYFSRASPIGELRGANRKGIGLIRRAL